MEINFDSVKREFKMKNTIGNHYGIALEMKMDGVIIFVLEYHEKNHTFEAIKNV